MKAEYYSLPAGYTAVSRVGISIAKEKIKNFQLAEEVEWD